MTSKLYWLFALTLVTGCVRKEPEPLDLSQFKPLVNKISSSEKRPAVPHPVKSSFGLSAEPRIVNAYKQYTQFGKAPSITSDGFTTLAYDAYAKPLIACAPYRLCAVQLEQGERINNIELGDTAHWMIHSALVGTPSDGSYQITIKPRLVDTATDMIVTTDKRTYHIGLVSKKGESSHIINFYYPQASLHDATRQASHFLDGPLNGHHLPSIDASHLNFNYHLSSAKPDWRPIRVFDDRHKTYIQMPEQASGMDLPVLYLKHQGEEQIVNYRYMRPYYIVDGVFSTAVLVSGNGNKQQKLVIQRYPITQR